MPTEAREMNTENSPTAMPGNKETMVERISVQCSGKSRASQIAEGQRIHYNFVRPHEALEGQTPAQRASVGIEGENKWLELLRKALIHD